MVVDLKRRLGRLSPELGAHLEIISKKISAIFSNQRQEDFTDHKPDGHSERIIRILNDLCSEMMEMKDKKLNVQEIFVLLASAYVHDVGMQYGKDSTLTLMDVRERHHLLSEEMIRGSIQKPTEYPDLGIPKEYVDQIAKVSRGHRKTNLYTDEYNPIFWKGEQIRLRLLAALLSLADDLDITSRRVSMQNLMIRVVPQESRVHWWRCYYVDGVEIKEGNICIHYTFPSEEYKELVAPSIEDQLENNMNLIQSILWPEGVRLHLGKSSFSINPVAKDPMNPEDLSFLRGLRSRMMEKSRAHIEREAGKRADFYKRTQETIGLDAKYRCYELTLKRSAKWGNDVLEGSIFYRATIKNDADERKPLFPGALVCEGSTTIPKPLQSKSLRSPEIIVSFKKLQIDGRSAHFDKSIGYQRLVDKPPKIVRTISCDATIRPTATRRVSYEEKLLFDSTDTFRRLFLYSSTGIVEVDVHHPDIATDIVWYSSPESYLEKAKIVISRDHTMFSAHGKWMPKDGFQLEWRG